MFLLELSLLPAIRAANCTLSSIGPEIGRGCLDLFKYILSYFPCLCLHSRKVTSGGVASIGNSCILSVLLQEFAACSKAYDVFLRTPLHQRPAESPEIFEQRREAQQILKDSVDRIRRGVCVEAQEVESLFQILHQLGWEGFLSSVWSRFFYWIAPNCFPLPQFSVQGLYHKVLEVLEGDIEQIPLRFVPGEGPFEIDNLKLVHARKITETGSHVVVYRREREKWFLCDDERVEEVDAICYGTPYLAVYDCR